jgi:hypothetical protein
MVHPVEKFGQVYVYDMCISFNHVPFALLYGIMRGSAGPESIAEFREKRVPYLFKDLGYGLLDKPIKHRGYSK